MEWIANNRVGIAQACLWAWIVVMLFQLFYRRPKPFWVTILNLALLAGFIYFDFIMKS
jgi:hypothetical protein